jgi:glucokinase
VAGNLALTLGAFGGVYVGGGIVPRYVEIFRHSGFRERFEAKGRYREYLGGIRTSVIIAPHATLTGLLAYAAAQAPSAG